MKHDELEVGEFYALGRGINAKRVKVLAPDPGRGLNARGDMVRFELDDGRVRAYTQSSVSALVKMTWAEHEKAQKTRRDPTASRAERSARHRAENIERRQFGVEGRQAIEVLREVLLRFTPDDDDSDIVAARELIAKADSAQPSTEA